MHIYYAVLEEIAPQSDKFDFTVNSGVPDFLSG